MNNFKKQFIPVMKFVKKHDNLTNKVNLIDKTFVISGGTRGIGLSIAKKLASVGANVTLLGKTKNPHKKLEGTIDTAVEDIVKIHNDKNKVLGMVCDIRNESDIDNSIDQTLSKFKKIDGVILNASALCLSPTLHATEKEVNLMTDVNIKGTFNVGKKCLKWIWFGRKEIRPVDFLLVIDRCAPMRWSTSSMNRRQNTIVINIIRGLNN